MGAAEKGRESKEPPLTGGYLRVKFGWSKAYSSRFDTIEHRWMKRTILKVSGNEDAKYDLRPAKRAMSFSLNSIVVLYDCARAPVNVITAVSMSYVNLSPYN